MHKFNGHIQPRHCSCDIDPSPTELFKMSASPSLTKGPGAGDVIDVVQLTLDLLTNILDAMGAIERKIAIGIGNETKVNWNTVGVYFESGTSDVVLPEELAPQQAVLYNARKTNGPTATGAVGVVGFQMSDGNTLGVMFSVPFDYNLYSNWWNAKVYEGSKSVNHDMYKDLYYDADPFKGDDQYHEREDIGQGYKVKGVMSSSGTCTLMVSIRK